MCRTYDEAQRFYHATVDFLKSRLGLEINPKSPKWLISRKLSVFLGFKIKVVKQGKAKFGYIAKPVCPTKLLQKLKTTKRTNQRNSKGPTSEKVTQFNSTLLGIQNYFKYAVTIYMDLTEVNYSLRRVIRTGLRNNMKHMKFCETSVNFKRKTKGIQPNTKIYVVQNTPLLPVTGIHHKTRGIFRRLSVTIRNEA